MLCACIGVDDEAALVTIENGDTIITITYRYLERQEYGFGFLREWVSERAVVIDPGELSRLKVVSNHGDFYIVNRDEWIAIGDQRYYFIAFQIFWIHRGK